MNGQPIAWAHVFSPCTKTKTFGGGAVKIEAQGKRNSLVSSKYCRLAMKRTRQSCIGSNCLAAAEFKPEQSVDQKTNFIENDKLNLDLY